MTDNDRTRLLIEARLAGVQRVEKQRIIDAASNREKNLVEWIAKFYSDEGYRPALLSAFLECGADESAVDAYVEESKIELMDALGHCCTHQETLAELQDTLAGWHTRLPLLALPLASGFPNMGAMIAAQR